ncbi:MAG: hypothetical protein WBP94_01055 [Rhodomicrobiaceae bacterium]
MWRTFAESLPADFFARMQAAPEAAIYFNRPPDHLVPNGTDGVRWSGNAVQPHDAAILFDSIKTARNNLFHGDKAHDNDRDKELRTTALFILNAAYEAADPTFVRDRAPRRGVGGGGLASMIGVLTH